MTENKSTAILLLSCPDQKGLVARIAEFIFKNQGNIIDLDEHVDLDEQRFFIRVAWDLNHFKIPAAKLEEAVQPLAEQFNANWKVYFYKEKLRIAVFVSKKGHCLQEILWRYQNGELNIEIPLIISNHDLLKPIADSHRIPFFVFPINKQNKPKQEEEELKLLSEHRIDTVVLARYMQILTGNFIRHYPNRIINIHHSFLPAFAGANPYKQAFERGVKIIGATSHYVTEQLDQGPIIEQDIVRVSHRDTLRDMKRKGSDLERLVLARALRYHSEHRILVQGNKTIVFK
ncbi:MAG: formyltetrahydrofolate deformylase [Calditrichaeota bacterium]|nr:formyltetrahydrofolate deformylase [Calditrichota bacterium]